MRTIRKASSWVVVAVAAACTIVLANAARAEGEDAGLVVDYAPSRASHAIFHGGSATETPVRLGTVVQASDVVRLRGAGHVTIQLADGTEKDIDGPGEWRVPESRQPGAFKGILRGLAGLLEKQAAVAASAASRGPESCDSPKASTPIRVPILSEHSRVSAGTQTLAIGWFGGCPPFAVSLRSSEVGAGHAEGLAKRLQKFTELNLVPGQYQLRIQDRFGTSASFTIDVVAAAPPMPSELTAGRSSSDVIARALWLADQDAGTWRLESLKTLRPLIAQKNKIASQLADYLLSSND